MASDRILELLRRPVDVDEYAEIRELWKTHSIAEDNRDLPGLISTLTEDCVYEVMGTGARWEGHEGAARFYTELLTAFPDIHFDLEYIVIGPQGVCEEARVTATHEARWLEHEPTGERLEWRNAIFFPWDPAAKKFQRRDGLHGSRLPDAALADGDRSRGRVGRQDLRRPPLCDRRERVDDRRVELLPASGVDLQHRLVQVERDGVRAIGRHRVPGVGDRDDRGLDRDVRPAQPVRIAEPVPALVVVPDRRARSP